MYVKQLFDKVDISKTLFIEKIKLTCNFNLEKIPFENVEQDRIAYEFIYCSK